MRVIGKDVNACVMLNRMEKRKQEETGKMLMEMRLGLIFRKLCK
jgi:hypothetical protein